MHIRSVVSTNQGNPFSHDFRGDCINSRQYGLCTALHGNYNTFVGALRCRGLAHRDRVPDTTSLRTLNLGIWQTHWR